LREVFVYVLLIQPKYDLQKLFSFSVDIVIQQNKF